MNESLYRVAKEALLHRDGTYFEDLYILHAKTGAIIEKNTGVRDESMKFRVGLTKEQEKKLEDKGISFEILHNHPGGNPPSISDIRALFKRKHAVASTVIGHNGILYRIERLRNFDEDIDELIEKVYNSIKSEDIYISKDQLLSKTRNNLLNGLQKDGYISYRKR